ncbi:MAG: PKD domain-containing protein, partial [Thaumarchaeota archaeon]|nr:PKD domain-containing protein [Nitrososphaerota archaeon]
MACASFALLPAAAPAAAAPSDDFVTVWDVVDDKTIRIPVGGATGTYTIDWGDGNTGTGVSGDQEHTYAQPGIYTVRISGDFTRILLGGDPANSQKLQSIEQWGSIQWSSMESAFAGASNMRYNADDYPDLSGVSSMSQMFSSTDNFDA